MLKQNTQQRIINAITDKDIALEIIARLHVSSAPVSANAAQVILNNLDKSKNEAIQERLVIALAGDGRGAGGKELAKKINKMIKVLEAKANGDEVSAVAAQFVGQVAGMTTDVTIDADVAGAAGNVTLAHDYVAAVAAQFVGQVAGMTTDVTIDADVAGAAGNVTLTGDGTKDIDTLISDWNTANPANTLSLSVGVGTQVPDNLEDIVLASGADSTGSDIDALIAAWNIANASNELSLSVGDGSQVPQADIILSGGSNSSDTDIAPAKLEMGSEQLSDSAKYLLDHALADVDAANDFKAAYNAMIVAIQAIS